MSKKRNSEGKRISFGELQFQVSRLHGFLAILVAIIAVVPPSVFFILDLKRFQEIAVEHSTHFAIHIGSQVEGGDLDLRAISSQLADEIGSSGIAGFLLTGPGRKEILRVGDVGPSFLTISSASKIGAGSLDELYVKVDERPLFYRTARVVTIHLLVAAFLAVSITYMGIRPLRRAINELNSVQAQLMHSEKLSSIGEIYAGLTHEINNPLGIILAKVSLLLGGAKEKQLSPDAVRDLETIHRHGSRIAEIIRGLLTFARRTSFDLTQTQLNRVIDETVSLVEKPFSKSQIQIERQLDPYLPEITASPAHLQQVFVNLLNNARDAMPRGGTITIRTFRNGRYLVCEVRDTGNGISQDIGDRVFEPFFTTKAVGKGTGLGLSVSYGIVRSHGGDLEVESDPGRGALFRLRLPIGGTSL